MSTRIAKTRHPMRKEPRQARARATVDAIIQAGAHILNDRGWAGFTTNEVAAIAGVSIGSLYQYFPNKLSLVDAIRRAHLADVLAALGTAGKGRKPLPHLVRDLVDGMIALHSVHPALHRVLLDEVPYPEGSRSAHDLLEVEYLNRYQAIIAAHQPRRGAAVNDIAAHVLSSVVEGVIHNAVRWGILNAPELKDELVAVICAYLRSMKSPARGMPRALVRPPPAARSLSGTRALPRRSAPR